jgi:uncharacterized membrane protein
VNRNMALISGGILVLMGIALAMWAYPQLPERVPTHWDAAGHVNGYSSRVVAASLEPLIMAFTLGLMIVLPFVSPKGFGLERSANPFYVSTLAIVAILLVIEIAVTRAALSDTFAPNAVVIASVGALFAILGNVMGKVRKNFFFGVRTPWTLASDEVWLRTNRLGGQLLVLGGLVLIGTSFFKAVATPATIGVVVVIVLVPVVYSYVLYKRIEGFDTHA